MPRSGSPSTTLALTLGALVGLIALVLYLVTAAPTITWRNGGIDSGELATAVATGSVAHPPGYPTYLLLGRAAAWLPVEPARALAWLSALSAALTCAAVAFALGRGPGGTAPRNVLEPADMPAVVAPGLWLATSPLLWSSATYAEVNAPAAAVAALWLALRAWRPRPARALLLLGVALGVALGIHVLLAFLVAGAALGQLATDRRPQRVAALALGTVAGALPVFATLALYPPAGPVNWYAPQTPEGWLLLVSADAYRGLLDPANAPVRFLVMLRALVENLGFVGAVAVVAGLQEVLARPAARQSSGTLLCAGIALAYVVFAALYAARDADSYLLPALVLLVPAAAGGIRAAARALTSGALPRTARLRIVLITLLVAAPSVAQIAVHAGRLDLTRDREALVYAERVLDGAPRAAAIVASGDAATFALWYARYALGRRPDVAVLNEDLLAFAWYRDHVGALHRDLVIPPVHESEAPMRLLSQANPGRVVPAPAAPIADPAGPGKGERTRPS